MPPENPAGKPAAEIESPAPDLPGVMKKPGALENFWLFVPVKIVQVMHIPHCPDFLTFRESQFARQQVVYPWSESPGIPGALLKLARAYRQNGMAAKGQKCLEVICQKYPNSTEAEVASRESLQN